MKNLYYRLLLILGLIGLFPNISFATDRTIPCDGANCKINFETKNGSNVKSSSGYIDYLGMQLRGRTDGSAVTAGNIGEILSYTLGDSTNRSCGVSYDYTQASIPAGTYYGIVQMQPGLFENHANALNAGIYSVFYDFSTVSASGVELARSNATGPSWGNGTNSYVVPSSVDFVIQKNASWTLYMRAQCAAYGTTSLTWYRVNTVTIKLLRLQ